jgi:hypothetical protein
MLTSPIVVHHHMLGYSTSPELGNELSEKVLRRSFRRDLEPAINVAFPASNSVGRPWYNLHGVFQA